MDVFVEGLEDRKLRLNGQRHVVLDGVQRAQHEVEHAHRVAQPGGLVRQLLDDHRKAAPTQGWHMRKVLIGES